MYNNGVVFRIHTVHIGVLFPTLAVTHKFMNGKIRCWCVAFMCTVLNVSDMQQFETLQGFEQTLFVT